MALSRADNSKIFSNRTVEQTLLNSNLVLLRKNGYSYGEFIDTKITKLNPKQVITNSDNITMLKMIHSRRADYFFIAEEEAYKLIFLPEFKADNFKYIQFNNMPEGNKRYLLFSKMVKDEVILKINTAIKEGQFE